MSPLFKLLACAAVGVQLFLGCFGTAGGRLCLRGACCREGAPAVAAPEACCCCVQDEDAPGAALAEESAGGSCGCCVQVPPLSGGTGLVGPRTPSGDQLRLFFAVTLSAPAELLLPDAPPRQVAWPPPPDPVGPVHASIATTHLVI
jgi:hypothetical protein